jgi:hypothetical protein
MTASVLRSAILALIGITIFLLIWRKGDEVSSTRYKILSSFVIYLASVYFAAYFFLLVKPRQLELAIVAGVLFPSLLCIATIPRLRIVSSEFLSSIARATRQNWIDTLSEKLANVILLACSAAVSGFFVNGLKQLFHD